MDIFKLLLVFIGCVLLGILVGFMAHSVWSGLGIFVLMLFSYIFHLLSKENKPKDN